MRLEDLTPELQEKAAACETPEEIIALAREEGYELTEDELDQVSGGASWNGGSEGPRESVPQQGDFCTACGSYIMYRPDVAGTYYCNCKTCFIIVGSGGQIKHGRTYEVEIPTEEW